MPKRPSSEQKFSGDWLWTLNDERPSTLTHNSITQMRFMRVGLFGVLPELVNYWVVVPMLAERAPSTCDQSAVASAESLPLVRRVRVADRVRQ
jgi:hypothetical protein